MRQKYRSENIIFRDLKGQVTVPNFQRKLVWSKSEKKEFIKTLHNGYPFGSILVYQYEENKSDKKYTLIDGLQRYTTILEFEKEPETYLNFDVYAAEILTTIDDENTLSPSTKRKLETEIKNSISSMISEGDYKNDPLLLHELLKKSCSEIGIDIEDKLKQIVPIQSEIARHVDGYLNIDNIHVPTIFFTGDENELANVFENLNRGGKKLTKYQVFAAQWSNYLLKLSQEKYSKEIIDRVINRYNNLIDQREVDIEGYDEGEIRRTRQINLSEFCYGLGEIILENINIFWNSHNEDLANVIGYSTMAIVLNIDLRKLNKIIDKKDLFEDANLIEELIKEIVEVYSDINNHFKNILKYPGSTDRYENQSAKNYQILSFFASLWSTRFEDIEDYNELTGKLKRKSKYSRNYKIIKKNFIAHYINDIYSGYWSGTGDSKVNSIRENKGLRYRTKIERERLESVLYDWWKERQQSPSINFDANSRTLIVIQSYYDEGNYENETYELEHVIPKKHLQDIYRSRNIPGGTLGNLMLLEKSLNRLKKELSIYDTSNEYTKIDREKLNNRFYPSESEFNAMKKEIESDSSDMENLKRIINNRGSDIINNLLDSMVRKGDLID